MTDLHAGMILAAVQVIVMFGGMRTFYGCWPWEHHKTWYATKPLLTALPTDGSFNIGTHTVKWMARDPLEQLIMPVATPPDIADSFQRNEQSRMTPEQEIDICALHLFESAEGGSQTDFEALSPERLLYYRQSAGRLLTRDGP